jgi:E3 ubiquitin-protein ligase HECTD2
VLADYSEELQKKFLLFTTGSDRVPVGGMGEMTFKITRINNKFNNLPEAHTCFNQVRSFRKNFSLPPYPIRGQCRDHYFSSIFGEKCFSFQAETIPLSSQSRQG